MARRMKRWIAFKKALRSSLVVSVAVAYCARIATISSARAEPVRKAAAIAEVVISSQLALIDAWDAMSAGLVSRSAS